MPIARDRPRGRVERLRFASDGGKAGEKIPVFDPATAPLGSDEEAAGTPLAPDILDKAYDQERMRRPRLDDRPGIGHAWILIAVVGAIAAGASVWAVLTLL